MRISYRRCFTLAVTLFTALSAFPVCADSDFRFFGSLAIQEKRLRFTLVGFPFNFSQNSYNFTFGGAYNRFYALVETERPFSQTSLVSQGSTPIQFTLERRDNALTVGYNAWQSLNVFAGYKTGETNVQLFPSGASTEALKFTYNESGYFVGASYSIDFDARGQLGLSVAYADLPTELTRTSQTSGEKLSTRGTTSGTSYGVKWTGPLSQGLDYSIGYKQSNYRFDDERRSIENKDFQTNQTYRTFFVSLSRVF